MDIANQQSDIIKHSPKEAKHNTVLSESVIHNQVEELKKVDSVLKPIITEKLLSDNPKVGGQFGSLIGLILKNLKILLGNDEYEKEEENSSKEKQPVPMSETISSAIFNSEETNEYAWEMVTSKEILPELCVQEGLRTGLKTKFVNGKCYVTKACDTRNCWTSYEELGKSYGIEIKNPEQLSDYQLYDIGASSEELAFFSQVPRLRLTALQANVPAYIALLYKENLVGVSMWDRDKIPKELVNLECIATQHAPIPKTFTKLTEIYTYSTKVDINKYPHLKGLKISFSNADDLNILKDLSKQTNLEYLNAGVLTELPDTLVNLTYLKADQLKIIPPTFTKLEKIISFGKDSFSVIPDSVAKNLKSVLAGDNLHAISDKLVNVEHFDSNSSQISSVPGNLKKLKVLFIPFANIQTIPPTLKNIEKIVAPPLSFCLADFPNLKSYRCTSSTDHKFYIPESLEIRKRITFDQGILKYEQPDGTIKEYSSKNMEEYKNDIGYLYDGKRLIVR